MPGTCCRDLRGGEAAAQLGGATNVALERGDLLVRERPRLLRGVESLEPALYFIVEAVGHEVLNALGETVKARCIHAFKDSRSCAMIRLFYYEQICRVTAE